jgi:hypothetical protein
MTQPENTTDSERRSDLLKQARLDAFAGYDAIRTAQWERAALYFRLAIDQMKDTGVLRNV